MWAAALQDKRVSKKLICLGKSNAYKTCVLHLNVSLFAYVSAHTYTHTRPLGALSLGVLGVLSLPTGVLWPGLLESRILDLNEGAALSLLSRLSSWGVAVHTQ